MITHEFGCVAVCDGRDGRGCEGQDGGGGGAKLEGRHHLGIARMVGRGQVMIRNDSYLAITPALRHDVVVGGLHVWVCG